MNTNNDFERHSILTSMAISYQSTMFGPVLFAGRLEEGFRSARINHFNAVEIGMRDPNLVDVHWIAEKLSEYGLQFSAIATGQSYLHDQLSLFTSNYDIARLAVHRFQRFIDFAEPFGASVIIGGIRGRLSGDVQEQNQQREIGIKSIRECSAYAQDHGVTLLLEAINRYETNLINSAKDGLDMIDEVGAPNIRLLLDTFHMNIEERDFSDAIQLANDRLGYIHFADSNRKAPGEGHIPFFDIISTLRKIRYTGYISAEIVPLPDDETAAIIAGKYIHDLLCASKETMG